MTSRSATGVYFMATGILVLFFWGLIRCPVGQAEPRPQGRLMGAASKSLMSFDGVDLKSLTLNPKLDSSLASLAAADPAARPAVATISGQGALKIMNGQVEVMVSSQEGRREEAAAAVVKAGGTVISLSPGNSRRFKATLPIEALNQVADQESVSYVKRPQYLPTSPAPLRPSTLETRSTAVITSEALDDMNVPIWHEKEGQGQGIKIGIIDAGFEGYPGLLGTELPSQVTVNNYVQGQGDPEVNGGGAHGAACAEVIHDIAPLSDLYFAKVDDADDVATAAGWLAGEGVKVISTSLGWYTVGPGDGTGPLGEAVTDAKNNGILWATAAGNERQLHWGGTFNPLDTYWGGTPVTVNIFGDTLGFINCFGSGGEFPSSCDLIPSGTNLSAYLRWAVDNWDEADMDYDLYLVRWTIEEQNPDWLVVAGSWDLQRDVYGQNPVESIVDYTTTGSPTYYGIFVSKCLGGCNAPDVNLEVFSPHYAGRLRHYTTPRSISNLADATDAITVTAVEVNGYAQEDYSSEGPRNGPKGTDIGATVVKPDMAAYSKVSTASFGPTAFEGTSAAAPHVAGAAALVFEAFPRFNETLTRNYLQNRAMDLGSPLDVYLYGHGRLYLGEPPQVVAEHLSAIMHLLCMPD